MTGTVMTARFVARSPNGPPTTQVCADRGAALPKVERDDLRVELPSTPRPGEWAWKPPGRSPLDVRAERMMLDSPPSPPGSLSAVEEAEAGLSDDGEEEEEQEEEGHENAAVLRERERGLDLNDADPLELSKARRTVKHDAEYVRAPLSESDIVSIKASWQGKNLRNVGFAAATFGPRASQRCFYTSRELAAGARGPHGSPFGGGALSDTNRVILARRDAESRKGIMDQTGSFEEGPRVIKRRKQPPSRKSPSLPRPPPGLRRKSDGYNWADVSLDGCNDFRWDISRDRIDKGASAGSALKRLKLKLRNLIVVKSPSKAPAFPGMKDRAASFDW